MNNTILSIIPPLLIILMVIFTKRVVLSLGVGVLVGSFIVSDFDFIETLSKLYEVVRNLFLDGNSLNIGNLYILSFLILLGTLTGFITILGGNEAFGRLAKKKIKSKQSALMTTAGMGMTIFPDDVFNMFSVGQIARPIVDAHKISRQKLAYLLHTTADPLCVLCPISSWGAYIISILAMIFVTNEITQNALVAFVTIAPMNFYAITSILLVFTVAYFNINIGKMKTYEEKSNQPNENSTCTSTKGSIWDLLLPIGTLIITVLITILITGIQGSNSTNLVNIFEYADVSFSLIIGASLALTLTLFLFLRKVYIQKSLSLSLWKVAMHTGIKTTLPAVIILLFAWMVSDLTKQLETGYYLAGLIENIDFPIEMLPFIMFIFTGIMAFSTGTSWGTFAIMLPISAQISLSMDETTMLPMMAAVLAGSLFGDHCSPISDTTTVASAAAGCPQFEHFQTQLPYALIAASITALSFILFGLTSSYILSYVFIIGCISIFVLLTRKRTDSKWKNEETRATF